MVKLRYYKEDSQIGHPRVGFNWYWEDSFVCPKCKIYLFVLWENLSSNDEDELECPKCHHRFLVTCSLNELLNGILIGAPYPGLNIANNNIFRCPTCLNYLKEKDVKLPMEGICDHCYSEWKFYPHRFREEIQRGGID